MKRKERNERKRKKIKGKERREKEVIKYKTCFCFLSNFCLKRFSLYEEMNNMYDPKYTSVFMSVPTVLVRY